MERVQLNWYAQLGIALNRLSECIDREPPTAAGTVMYEIWTAKHYLDVLVAQGQTNLQLRVSRPAMQTLLEHLDGILSAKDTMIEQYNNNRYLISHFAKQAETILYGELAVQNCYLVRPKRIFDVDLLAEDATRIFSDEVRVGLTDLERYDIQQAGRCLAFEVPTAALFHVFRAADSVLRRWYKQVTNTEPKPKMRSWGTYLTNLRKCEVNPKIISALEQIKDLHRNPVIHPELLVSIEEALSFLGIAESVINVMVCDIYQRRADEAGRLLWDGVVNFLPRGVTSDGPAPQGPGGELG